jgi:tetratricopeptide (TPR) repeat protein
MTLKFRKWVSCLATFIAALEVATLSSAASHLHPDGSRVVDRQPTEFTFPISIENAGTEYAPQPEDFVVTTQGTVLPVVSVQPVPDTAPVLVILHATSLLASDLSLIQRDLSTAVTGLKERGAPVDLAVINPQESTVMSLLAPDGSRVAHRQPIAPTALAKILEEAISRRALEDGQSSLEQHLQSLDRISRVIQEAAFRTGSVSDRNTPLRIILLARDLPQAILGEKSEPRAEAHGLEASHPRPRLERGDSFTGYAAQLFDTFIPLLAQNDVSFHLANFGVDVGFFTRLAQQIGGRVSKVGASGLDYVSLLANPLQKTYTLSVKWEEPRFSFRPLPLSIQYRERQRPESPSDARLRAPRSFWPLPAHLRLPTYDGLREAARLRQQLSRLSQSRVNVEAMLTGQKVVELSPFTLDDRLRLVRLYRDFDVNRAHQLLEQSAALFPEAWEIPYERGVVYELQEEMPAALHSYETALALKAKEDATALSGGDLTLAAKAPELDLRLARLYVKANRSTEAVARFDKVVDTNLDGATVRLEFATLLWTQGRTERAEKEARRAVEFDPKNLPAHELLAEIYFKTQQYSKALDRARAALDAGARSLRVHHVAGMSLARLDRYEEALPYLKQAAAKEPRNFELQYALYHSFNRLGQVDEAIAALQAAKSIDKKDPALFVQLAELYQKRGDFFAIGKALEEGASNTSGDLNLHYRLAEWLERRGQADRAIASYRAAAAMAAPEMRSQIHERIGLLQLLQGERLDEAARSLEKTSFPLPDNLATPTAPSIGHRPSAIGHPDAPQGRLILPGGVHPILRFAPFLHARRQDETYLGLLFDYVLEAEPPNRGQNKQRQLLRTFYEQYLAFTRWLKERRLLAPEILLTFSTNKDDLKRANTILSYFGAELKTKREGKGKITLRLEVDKKRKYEDRRTVLKLLGLNLDLIRENSTFTFLLKDEAVPILFRSDYWIKEVLGQRSARPEEALWLWLENPEAMQLYVALSRLPDEACQWLKTNFTARELLEELMPGLFAFGGLLKFHPDGGLRIPGGQDGDMLWGRLVGAASAKNHREFVRKLFTKDDGRAIYYFAALSQASPAVEPYFFDSPERFRKCYEYIGGLGDAFKQGMLQREHHDLADLIMLLSADSPGAPKMEGWRDGEMERRGNGEMASLSPPLSLSPSPPLSFSRSSIGWLEKGDEKKAGTGVEKYAMLRHLSQIRPDLFHVNGHIGSALEVNQARFAGQFGLIADLNMDTDSTLKWLQRLQELDKQDADEMKRTRLMLFQATMGFLQTLAHQHVLGEQTRRLTAEFLDLYNPSASPGVQAIHIGRFLTGRVLPILAATFDHWQKVDGWDLFLQGLAGSTRPVKFFWNGQRYEITLAERERRRLTDFLHGQRVTPLEPLLKAFHALDQLRQAPSRTLVEEIHQLCQHLSEPVIEGKIPEAHRQAMIHTNRKRLDERLLRLDRANTRDAQKQALEVADELAPFFGESLMALLYAVGIPEDDLVTQADENFVRKHDFALRSDNLQPEESPWKPAKVIRQETIGSRIQGSLVGLPAALATLKAEQIDGGVFTRFAEPTFPLMQRTALALVNPADLSGEVLAYAAECMNLAERLLAAAALDREIRRFCEAFISERCGERRAFAMRKHLAVGHISAVKEMMLPSELFHLGKQFHEHRGIRTEYPWHFLQMTRLDDLRKQLDPAGVSQLGFPATSWHGMPALTLESVAPVETMTTYLQSERIAERSCELKLQLARIFWRTGLPTVLFKPVADGVLEKVMGEVGQASSQDWEPILRAIQTMNEQIVVETAVDILNSWQSAHEKEPF